MRQFLRGCKILLDASAVFPVWETSFTFKPYRDRFSFAIKTSSDFVAFRSSDTVTNRDWREWNLRDKKQWLYPFLIQKQSSFINSRRCINCNSLHTEKFSSQLQFSSFVGKTFCRFSLLSTLAMASARNSCSVPNKSVNYFIAEISESPGYGTRKSPGVASTPIFSTKSPWQIQRREGSVSEVSSFIVFLAHNFGGSESTLAATLAYRASIEESASTSFLLFSETLEIFSSSTNLKLSLSTRRDQFLA